MPGWVRASGRGPDNLTAHVPLQAHPERQVGPALGTWWGRGDNGPLGLRPPKPMAPKKFTRVQCDFITSNTWFLSKGGQNGYIIGEDFCFGKCVQEFTSFQREGKRVV